MKKAIESLTIVPARSVNYLSGTTSPGQGGYTGDNV